MSSLTLQEADYKNWQSWQIQKERLTLVLLPQLGGRLMQICWDEYELCFVNPSFYGQVTDTSQITDIPSHKQNMSFPLPGGEKTWLAPQGNWSGGLPIFDLDSGQYTLAIEKESKEEIIISMLSPICRETGMQIQRRLKITASHPGWSIEHTLYNKGDKDARWGIWSVNMIRRPGRVYLKRNPNSPHPQGIKTFANEGESRQIKDQIISTQGDFVIVDCRGDRVFKYGADASSSSMLGVVDSKKHGHLAYLMELSQHSSQASDYAHECVFEVYNSPESLSYFEMEAHAPLVSIPPGRQTTLTIKQDLYSLNKYPETDVEIANAFAGI